MTNVYLEEAGTMDESTDRRECDVCSPGEMANHKCSDCQQFLCGPCLVWHNSFTLDRLHHILKVPDDEKKSTETGLLKSVKPETTCRLHPDSAQSLYCKTCALSICPMCEVALHEGHSTEDISVASRRARQQLHDLLHTVRRRVRELQVNEDDAERSSATLLKEKEYAESELHKRKTRVIEWAEQGYKNALEEAKAATDTGLSTLRIKSQRDSTARAGLVAQADHMNQVLMRGNHVHILKLQNDLESWSNSTSSAEEDEQKRDLAETVATNSAVLAAPLVGVADTSDNLTQTEVKNELCSAQENALCLHLQFDDSALSQTSILRYIGHVLTVTPPCTMPISCMMLSKEDSLFKSSNPSQMAEQTVTGRAMNMKEPGVTSTTEEDKKEEPVKIKSEPVTAEPHADQKETSVQARETENDDSKALTQTKQQENEKSRRKVSVLSVLHQILMGESVKEKKQDIPQPSLELQYSMNSKSEPSALCATSTGKLWVMYKPNGGGAEQLTLFNAKGERMNTWRENIPTRSTSFTSVGDTLLAAHAAETKGSEWSTTKYMCKWFTPEGDHGDFGDSSSDYLMFSQSTESFILKCVQEQTKPKYMSFRHVEDDKQFSVHHVTKGLADPPTIFVKSTSEATIKTVHMVGSPRHFDVSPCGQYFAFSTGKDFCSLGHSVSVLSKTSGTEPLQSLVLEIQLTCACFCQVKGKVYVAAVKGNMHGHRSLYTQVVLCDLLDGLNVLLTLDDKAEYKDVEPQFPFVESVRLWSGGQDRLWVALPGGKIRVFNLDDLIH